MFLSFVYPPLFLYISLSIQIDASFSIYLFFNPKSRLFLSILFSSSHSILYITYICLYLLSIHLCFFISLWRFRLMPISFNLFFNLKSRVFLSIPFSLSHSILYISAYICFYLLSIHPYFFISLCEFRLMPVSFRLLFNLTSRVFLSIPFSLSHSILCISAYICFYLLSIHPYFSISLCEFRLMLISFNPCSSS